MNVPENLLYTEDHEWVRREGPLAVIGITDFAQSELGDIVFVELPEIGSRLSAGTEFGTVESVKAVSEIFAPLSGEVVEVNEQLRESPQDMNADPYGAGWILKVRPSSEEEIARLRSAKDYAALVESSAH